MLYRWMTSSYPLLFVIAVCLTVTGCGSKVTKANGNKIKKHVSKEEVIGILGTPTTEESEVDGVHVDIPKLMDGIGGQRDKAVRTIKVQQLVWKDGGKSITVQFVGERVHACFTEGLD